MAHTSLETSTLFIFKPIEPGPAYDRWAAFMRSLGGGNFTPEHEVLKGYTIAQRNTHEGSGHFTLHDLRENVIEHFPDFNLSDGFDRLVDTHYLHLEDEGGDFDRRDVEYLDNDFMVELFGELRLRYSEIHLLAITETFVVDTRPSRFGGNWGGWHIHGYSFYRATSSATFEQDIAAAIQHATVLPTQYVSPLNISNFLHETKNAIWNSGHVESDVLCVLNHHLNRKMEWEEFRSYIQGLTYDQSSNDNAPSQALVVLFKDGTSMRRWNPSGTRHCWGYSLSAPEAARRKVADVSVGKVLVVNAVPHEDVHIPTDVIDLRQENTRKFFIMGKITD